MFLREDQTRLDASRRVLIWKKLIVSKHLPQVRHGSDQICACEVTSAFMWLHSTANVLKKLHYVRSGRITWKTALLKVWRCMRSSAMAQVDHLGLVGEIWVIPVWNSRVSFDDNQTSLARSGNDAIYEALNQRFLNKAWEKNLIYL